MKHQLRLYLEDCGVVLPSEPAEVFETVKENPDLEREILVWATLEFNLPFADTLILNAVPAGIWKTEYGKRLNQVLKMKGGNN